jgi:threonine aldolase
MKKWIDLRSDTVTQPGSEMVHAMMHAPVGDDVFGEDPTVNELEAYASALFGMEAGLFCPSGTMTNQIAIRVHTKPGDELICDAAAHILNYEGAGIAANSQVQPKVLHGVNGCLSAAQIAPAINADQDWLANTRLVCLENTVNRAGGSYYNFNEIKEIQSLCRQKKLGFHLDGARIFNALTETSESPEDYGKQFDSISVCLSKGLGAPVGSLLLGSKDFIKEARRVRKRFGGGMRQAGFLAAAGLYALQHNIPKLKEDHIKARQLYNALDKKSYISKMFFAYTNIVLFELGDAIKGAGFAARLKEKGILVSSFSGQTIRMVTHLDVAESEIQQVIAVLEEFGD